MGRQDSLDAQLTHLSNNGEQPILVGDVQEMESPNEEGHLSRHHRLRLTDHMRNTRMGTPGYHYGPIPRLHRQGLLDDGTYRARQVDAGKDGECLGDLDQRGPGAHTLLEGI